MPAARAMMRKNTGNDRERAARAWVEIRPPYRVSTTLNMVLKKKPVPAGTAMARSRRGMGWVRRSGAWSIGLFYSRGRIIGRAPLPLSKNRKRVRGLRDGGLKKERGSVSRAPFRVA